MINTGLNCAQRNENVGRDCKKDKIELVILGEVSSDIKMNPDKLQETCFSN